MLDRGWSLRLSCRLRWFTNFLFLPDDPTTGHAPVTHCDGLRCNHCSRQSKCTNASRPSLVLLDDNLAAAGADLPGTVQANRFMIFQNAYTPVALKPSKLVLKVLTVDRVRLFLNLGRQARQILIHGFTLGLML